MLSQAIRRVLRRCLPSSVCRVLSRGFRRLTAAPVVRQLRCVGLRRLTPLRAGRRRGTPIIRHYWADFLARHRESIRGHGLEIGSATSLREWGGAALTGIDVVDLTPHSPEVTIVADLTQADAVKSDTFDCFVNQFTMHMIYDVESALYHSVRVLKPGGVLLVNFTCCDVYFPRGCDLGTGVPLYVHWWFTSIQVENLLRRVGLRAEDYQLTVYGNLFARVAYQMNLTAEELTAEELAYTDPAHPVLICVRAVKRAEWRAERPVPRTPWLPEGPPTRWDESRPLPEFGARSESPLAPTGGRR